VTGLVVVDVGNTRVKWGRCEGGRVAEVAALPSDTPDHLESQVNRWALGLRCLWVVSGVHPARRDALVGWLRDRQFEVRVLDSPRELPLAVRVDEPAKVGIDRLLNAVAVNTRRASGAAAVIVDAGSAVTVDLVDHDGAFRGGAILPGLRLMARALHDYTALLPVVDVDRVEVPPGTSTTQAVRAGISHAVLGGIERIIAAYREQTPAGLRVFVTGGDGPVLAAANQDLGERWPEMTLAGILHSVPEAVAHD
jgi:type III pantothenate kinase